MRGVYLSAYKELFQLSKKFLAFLHRKMNRKNLCMPLIYPVTFSCKICWHIEDERKRMLIHSDVTLGIQWYHGVNI